MRVYYNFYRSIFTQIVKSHLSHAITYDVNPHTCNIGAKYSNHTNVRTENTRDRKSVVSFLNAMLFYIMMLSFIHPTTCGFARGIAWEISKTVDSEWKFGDDETRAKLKQSSQITERFNRFSAAFESCKENFGIDFKLFRKILPDLRTKFSRWTPRKIHERNQYTATFNIKSWKSLSQSRKVQHTFENCRACNDRYVSIQSLFPIKSSQFTGYIRPKIPSSINDAIDGCLREQGNSSKGCSKRKAVETARAVYNRINPSFESVCKISLSAALTNVQELKIEEKKTKNEKRNEQRQLYKKSKGATEAEWEKTDIARYIYLHLPNRDRKIRFFLQY